MLVVGLLLIGRVVHDDGMFDRAAEWASRARGGATALLLALLIVVAVVTAVLNLDTSVAFLTPVLVLTARRRGLAVEPFLFGSLFMANAASLLLPGSSLTNLLVLAGEHVSGGLFAARMLPAWLASITVTAVVLVVRYRGVLHRQVEPDYQPPARLGRVGIVAAGLVVALRSPALPVAGLGALAVGVKVRDGRLSRADVAAAVDLAVLVGLFGFAVGLGTLAGVWSGPAELMRSASRWESAAIGATAAVAVNNLPAAVLLSARAPAHPRALLVGLDLGPNLAVTGSLSALLWYQAARPLVSARRS